MFPVYHRPKHQSHIAGARTSIRFIVQQHFSYEVDSLNNVTAV